MKIKFIKEVEIMALKFSIKWDKTHDGGCFNLSEGIIEIGFKDYKRDPLYTISILSHELMEIILQRLGARYINAREQGKYLFSFNHQTFETAIQIHTEVMMKFLG